MGESLVEAPKVENKMGESITHVPCLQESVSFGRFEHDSLCWERWSTFPTNKYLEEVEKCSTPGSVAQKKAYFEAHYNKIAARKAALLEEEMRREAESMNDENHIVTDSVCNSSEEELNVEKSNTHDSIYGAELENQVVDFAGDMDHEHIEVPFDGVDFCEEENEAENFRVEVSEHIDDEHIDVGDIIEEVEVVNFTNEVSEHIDEHNDGVDLVEQNKDFQPQPEDAAEDMCPNMESPELEMPENPVVMKEENQVVNISSEVSEHTKEPIDDAYIIEEIKDIQPQTEGTSDDWCPRMENPELKPEEPVSVKEVVVTTLVFEDKEELPQVKADRTKLAKKPPVNVAKHDNLKKMQKVTPVKKPPNSTGVKKKPASPMPKRSGAPMPKSPMVSTLKPAKAVLSKTAMSTTRPSVRKENCSTPMTNKRSTRPESKRVLPTSLHMSLRLGGPANTDPAALTTARKSLIMERMGDKDIVKRAFKAFQNSNQSPSSSLAKGAVTNQSVLKKIEPKCSNPSLLQKKNEGNLRSMKAANPRTGQQGPAKTSFSPGPRKTIGVNQRNVKSTPASYGTRGQDGENKLKEVPKKLEQKSEIKEAGKTQLQSKVKLQKAAQTGKPSQNIN